MELCSKFSGLSRNCSPRRLNRARGWNAVLENHQGRDSVAGVSFRLPFLSGYLESRAERGGGRIGNMHDITPEPEQDDDKYEAGNLVCLPGVKLYDVLTNGDQPAH